MITRNGVHLPMIFSMYLQVGKLDRSLSFYRDGLGLEVAWNDDTVAVLRGSGESAANLVLRGVGGGTKQSLGQAGVTRIGWQLTTPAELDSAEQRLKLHGAQYRRTDVSEAGRIVTHDPDGLEVILFLPRESSLTEQPPPFIYWYH